MVSLTPVYDSNGQVFFANPCTLVNLQGFFANTDDAWLQIHDSATVPAEGAVPLKSFALPSGTAFSWKFDPNVLILRAGLFVCVSSTEGTKTISVLGSGSRADFLIDLESYEMPLPLGYLTAGDLTTGVDSLTVWTASALKKLLQIDVINGQGLVAYLCIFGKNSLLVNYQPIIVLPLLNVATAQTFRFGVAGITPYERNVVVNANNILPNGDIGADCVVAIGVAAASGKYAGYTSTSTVIPNLNSIRAYYI